MGVKVFIIIATAFNRTELLTNRSLLSVYRQTGINPKEVEVIIVDDNSSKDSTPSLENDRIQFLVKDLRNNLQLRDNDFKTTILTNERTKGNSGTGAWNTGIFFAYGQNSESYLSILDDDDEYDYLHLADCLGKFETSPDAVAVFQHLRWVNCDGSTIEFPFKRKDLTPEIFFIGNPGIQASNMFFKTSALVNIGGFNENYPNTTDRDLMIRFLNSINSNDCFEVIEKIGVNHYNHNDVKVNNNLKAKQIGLDLFYSDYKSYFTREAYQKSLERAYKLFNYLPADLR